MRKVENLRQDLWRETCASRPSLKDILQLFTHGSSWTQGGIPKAGYDVVNGYGTLESNLVEVNTST